MKTALTLICLTIFSVVAAAQDLSVTVYNSNLGVVSETRNLNFTEGVDRLAFRDVPSEIDANSVRFDIADGSGNVVVLEQNYVFDLVSPDQMYNKYLDKEIELYDEDGKLYTGTLLAFNQGALTMREKSGRIKIIMLSKISEVSFPDLPEGLITKPTLFWLYRSDAAGERACKVSYQTRGLNWTAEYVGVLNADETKLDLSGWSAITNNSGKTYRDASLKLVAGEIHRVSAPPPRGFQKMYAAGLPEDAGFQEKEFFEYHLYTLPRKATVSDKEIKQISLFEPARSAVEKVFIYRPEKNPKQVEVALKFKNSAATGLGMPLPAGRARLFKADDDGSMILLGEDMIDHTPRDEEVNLKVGYAFDLVAEEKLTNQTRLSQQVEEREYEIQLRNHKSQDVVIEIEKKLYGFWEVMESNFEYIKKDAYTITFRVPVIKDGEASVKYRVRFSTR